MDVESVVREVEIGRQGFAGHAAWTGNVRVAEPHFITRAERRAPCSPKERDMRAAIGRLPAAHVKATLLARAAVALLRAFVNIAVGAARRLRLARAIVDAALLGPRGAHDRRARRVLALVAIGRPAPRTDNSSVVACVHARVIHVRIGHVHIGHVHVHIDIDTRVTFLGAAILFDDDDNRRNRRVGILTQAREWKKHEDDAADAHASSVSLPWTLERANSDVCDRSKIRSSVASGGALRESSRS